MFDGPVLGLANDFTENEKKSAELSKSLKRTLLPLSAAPLKEIGLLLTTKRLNFCVVLAFVSLFNKRNLREMK